MRTTSGVNAGDLVGDVSINLMQAQLLKDCEIQLNLDALFIVEGTRTTVLENTAAALTVIHAVFSALSTCLNCAQGTLPVRKLSGNCLLAARLSSQELIAELHFKFRDRQCHGRSTHDLRQIADRMRTTSLPCLCNFLRWS